MRTDILRDLASRLESGEIPAETFDMKHYVLAEGVDPNDERTDAMVVASRRPSETWCGTTACIAGHLALRYGSEKDLSDLRSGAASTKRTAMHVLGVDFYDTGDPDRQKLNELFGGEWKTVSADHVWDATPQMAARELRDLADRADRGELE